MDAKHTFCDMIRWPQTRVAYQ